MRIDDRQYGNGLLSRFHIKETRNYSFGIKGSFIERRSILEATVEIDNQLVNVYVTHLSLHPFLQKRQRGFFNEQAKIPTIIMGDWNMKPKTNMWKRITNVFNDVWDKKGIGEGFTFPSTKPRKRLDYIFVSKMIQIVDVKVVDSNPIVSDHLPVLATISITPHIT